MIRRATSNNVEVRLNISNVGPRFGLAKLTASGIRGALILVALSALLLFAARPMQGQTETVLYSFGGQYGDAAYPLYAGLALDKQGDLYGTTPNFGANNGGTVFKLTPTGTETVLHSFGRAYVGPDGSQPYGGVVLDKKGNLYGTTGLGGANNSGTVFEMTPDGAETVLYSFGNQPGDGAFPLAGLVLDKQGNLYGTTVYGGAHGGGTVFQLTPDGAETVLYSFGSQPGDGTNPYAGLVLDKKGNLYGTTGAGGQYGFGGTVFKVTP